MHETKNYWRNSLRLFCVLAIMIVGVAATRGISIWHGLTLHVDEVVFYSTSGGVVNDGVYTPYKSYPEGAFLLQVPFQWLGKITREAGIREAYTARNWARIASVAYFAIGCIAGAILSYRISGRRLRVACLYALLMTFSLMQIEMSRYGTGDPPSAMILLCMLLLLDLYFEKGAFVYVVLAFFLSGVLAAIKYPQIYFAVLPVSCLLLQHKHGYMIRFPAMLGAVLATAAGFLAFSPALLTRPQFLTELLGREFAAYLQGNNFEGYGTPLNNFASLLLYHLLYADAPFATPIMAAGVYALCKSTAPDRSPRAVFFVFVLPITAVLFAVYNVFMKAFFLRTLYPYFCICALYTAVGLDWLLARKGFRVAVCAVGLLTILRGGFLTYAMSKPLQEAKIEQAVLSSEDWPNYNRAVILGTDSLDCGVGRLGEGEILYYASDLYMSEPFPTLSPGEFALTAPYQFGFARRRMLGFPDEQTKTMALGWETFLQENKSYLLAKTYPDYYYYLFGYWMHGTTGTFFEFPTNYLFYKPLSAD